MSETTKTAFLSELSKGQTFENKIICQLQNAMFYRMNALAVGAISRTHENAYGSTYHRDTAYCLLPSGKILAVGFSFSEESFQVFGYHAKFEDESECFVNHSCNTFAGGATNSITPDAFMETVSAVAQLSAKSSLFRKKNLIPYAEAMNMAQRMLDQSCDPKISAAKIIVEDLNHSLAFSAHSDNIQGGDNAWIYRYHESCDTSFNPVTKNGMIYVDGNEISRIATKFMMDFKARIKAPIWGKM